MDYQALYRKYRPQTFGEVIGQDHVTRTLAHEIVENKVAHAYLFAGPRGTGKTTSARLLAKALNCTNRGEDGEPCTECASCIGIMEGTSLDVIELDAASHNKVEDIREIRVNVGTVAAVGGARRVYILDEAHMLSRAAGNALLKTLEEPPEHVVFVLATTEPYKLLDTIRSRAQRFDFHPVPVEVLVDYLVKISRREDFEPQHDALNIIAGHARGSVRDALSLLEQVAALGGGSVEVDAVVRALGLADKDAFGKLAVAISEQDAPAALSLVAELASQGADLRRFVGEAIGFFRGVFLAQYAPNLEEVADEPLDTLEEWRRFAEVLAPADVLRAVDGLADALFELRQGREERLVVELTLLRLTRPETAQDTAALGARLGRLEVRVRDLTQSGGSAKPVAAADSTAAGSTGIPADSLEPSSLVSDTAVTADTPGASPPSKVDGLDEETNDSSLHQDGGAPPASDSSTVVSDVADSTAPFPDTTDDSRSHQPPSRITTAAVLTDLDLDTVQTAWPAIVAQVRELDGPRRHALIKEATPAEVVGGLVTLEVPSHLPFHLEQMREDSALHGVIERAAVEVLGGSIGVAFRSAAEEEATASEPERAPDKDDLIAADSDEVGDPADLVVDLLGGEVVSE